MTPNGTARSVPTIEHARHAGDASIKIEGFTYTSPSNTITDAIAGVTLNLVAAKPGTTLNLAIAPDTKGVLDKVNKFISSYNGLQVDVTKRLSRGLTFRGSYTFSKNLDDGSGLASSQAQNQTQQALNPRDPLRDYGRSALDFEHQGSGNFTYELPFAFTGKIEKVPYAWLNLPIVETEPLA